LNCFDENAPAHSGEHDNYPRYLSSQRFHQPHHPRRRRQSDQPDHRADGSGAHRRLHCRGLPRGRRLGCRITREIRHHSDGRAHAEHERSGGDAAVRRLAPPFSSQPDLTARCRSALFDQLPSGATRQLIAAISPWMTATMAMRRTSPACQAKTSAFFSAQASFGVPAP
jgi:hypothetical protein